MSPPRKSTIINVSNRLPVTVSDDKITKSSGGLVAALEGVSTDQYDLKWLGWPGKQVAPERQEQVRRTLEREHGCAAVFISDAQAHGHYEGFSNSSLWPLLHLMPSKFRYERQWWDDYQAVNRKMADAVLNLAKPGDLVWVHDYQLMLLPAMLRECAGAANIDLKIGFFLHTPFPPYEVFRIH